jgi:polar amino acid transport system substrate-binding protein
MRVGVSEQPPWTFFDGSEPRGIEVDLVKDLAQELGSRVEWVRGSESELLQSLHVFRLDLVIGSIKADTLWSDRVGLTRPYVETTSIIGLPSGVTLDAKLDGVQIAVAASDPVAKEVEDQGAQPVADVELRAARLPVLTEDWQVARWGMQPTARVFAKHERVFAVPPGENGWLMALERFLLPRKAAIRASLMMERKS